MHHQISPVFLRKAIPVSQATLFNDASLLHFLQPLVVFLLARIKKIIAMIRITGLPAPKSQVVTPVIRRMVRVTETKSRAMAIARKALGVIICPPIKELRTWGKSRQC